MDCLRSPFAKNFEDEEMMNAAFSQLKYLINGDTQLATLYMMLALFSPISLTLSNEETHQLKYFQTKSSILLYEYLMLK